MGVKVKAVGGGVLVAVDTREEEHAYLTTMSGTIYSYKPVGEGASTVLTLKTGELLELRRGTKTRWSAAEPRQKWASVEAWKATLPAGAEVTVHGDPEAEAASVAVESDDFRRVREMLPNVPGGYMAFARLKLHTNKLDAAQLMAKCRQFERRRDRAIYAAQLRLLDAKAAEYRRYAEEKLAAAPYQWFGCRRANKMSIYSTLMARRADGVFVPLFMDIGRKLFHIVDRVRVADRHFLMKAAPTLAELGLEPVFLVRADADGLRMVTL